MSFAYLHLLVLPDLTAGYAVRVEKARSGKMYSIWIRNVSFVEQHMDCAVGDRSGSVVEVQHSWGIVFAVAASYVLLRAFVHLR